MDWSVRSVVKHLGVFALKYTGVLRVARRISTSRGFLTVSYTHLRAHETVLDLVCRLLLEKKK